MMNLTYIFSLLLFFSLVASEPAKFYVIREWKYINFTWPSRELLELSTSQGMYIPENNIIAGVKYHDDYFYITLPRMKRGVPATLARIKAGATTDTAPLLEPYPSWAMNKAGDCDNLQFVQNVEIDTKNQIWIIDGGRTETLTSNTVKCPPKLIVFDIAANRTKFFYSFPEEVASKNNSFLYDLVVDNSDDGYAYITDNSVNDPGIIVFSGKERKSWKIRHRRSMSGDPTATEFTVNGIKISTSINIAGIALGPKIHTSNEKVVVNEDREVYYAPLSSLHIYSINTTILCNQNFGENLDDVIKDIGVKPSQSVSMIMDNQGILYYSLLGNNAIGRWDSHTAFQSNQRLIARDNKYIEWPNSFTFDQNGNLTVLMNRLDKFVFDKININEANFRLITSNVGGKSYLFDDNFNYNHRENKMLPGSESVPEISSRKSTEVPLSTTTSEPSSSAISTISFIQIFIVASTFFLFL